MIPGPASGRHLPDPSSREETLRNDLAAFSVVSVLAFGVIAAPAVFAQGDPPELQPLGGTYECSILQDAAGDVLHLNCTESGSTLAENWDIEVYKVTRNRNDRLSVWLRSNVDMAGWRILLRFRHSSDPTYVDEETIGYSGDDKRRGETWSESIYPDFTWTSVEILADPTFGWVCQGCGTFQLDDIQVSNLIDPTSIRPEDAPRFLQEMQQQVLPRR